LSSYRPQKRDFFGDTELFGFLSANVDLRTAAGESERAHDIAQPLRSDAAPGSSFRRPISLDRSTLWGLPVIAARRGGPDWIVDDTCGLKIDVSEPKTFARDIADAVRRLSGDPGLRAELSAGARRRVTSFGTWPDKAARMIELYKEVLLEDSAAAADTTAVRKAG